jgi:hypothetical protein
MTSFPPLPPIQLRWQVHLFVGPEFFWKKGNLFLLSQCYFGNILGVSIWGVKVAVVTVEIRNVSIQGEI